MKKKNITFAVLLLAVVCTAFGVSSTYARYTAEDEGTGTASVAKWSVAVSGWEGSGTSKTLPLTPISNMYVADGVIAPDSTAVGILTVDLTGTQVATDISAALEDVTIDGVSVENPGDHYVTSFSVYKGDTLDSKILSDDADDYELDTFTESEPSCFLELNSSKTALVNQKVKVAVFITWKHDDVTNGWNTWDTSLGDYESTAPVVNAKINLTAKQHVSSDD